MPKEVQLFVGETDQSPNNRNDGFIDSDLKLITFHNIKRMKIGSEMVSPPFWCFEQKWQVKLRVSEERKMGLFLIHCPTSDNFKCQGQFSFVLPQIGKWSNLRPVVFTDHFYVNSGYDNPDDRSFGESNLFDCKGVGHDNIHVSLEMVLHSDDRITSLKGEDDKLRLSMRNILSDTDTSDVLFDVKGQIIHAHLAILKAMAPEFVEILNLEDYDNSNPVPIIDVEPQIFQTILEYIYGGAVTFPEPAEAEYAKAVIHASDKYGLENLKFAAEKFYVHDVGFEVNSVVETLMYADGKNCKILKEAALSYLIENMVQVAELPSFKTIYESESLTKEITLRQSRWLAGG